MIVVEIGKAPTLAGLTANFGSAFWCIVTSPRAIAWYRPMFSNRREMEWLNITNECTIGPRGLTYGEFVRFRKVGV